MLTPDTDTRPRADRVADAQQMARSGVPLAPAAYIGTGRALARAIGGSALEIAKALAEADLDEVDAEDERRRNLANWTDDGDDIGEHDSNGNA